MRHTLLALLMFSTPLLACPKAVDFNEMVCMADNLFHEAKVDGMRGMEAVAAVVMNRVHDSRWPDSVCGVVYQPSQFSWTLKKRLRNMTNGTARGLDRQDRQVHPLPCSVRQPLLG